MTEHLPLPKEQLYPTRRHFHVDNWFVWILEARDAGYSQADMRWILNTIGVMDELRRIVKEDERARKELAG